MDQTDILKAIRIQTERKYEVQLDLYKMLVYMRLQREDWPELVRIRLDRQWWDIRYHHDAAISVTRGDKVLFLTYRRSLRHLVRDVIEA